MNKIHWFKKIMQVKMQATTVLIRVLILSVVLTLLSAYILSDPGTPEIDVGQSERRTIGASGIPVQAQAGNVTALNINATRITDRWQGYYGNVSGTITLDDAFNNSMYAWSMANPEGEIYASNGSVSDWSTVFCFNFSNSKNNDLNKVQKFNGTDVENALGMDANDADGIDETFNETYTGSFNIGSSVSITGDSGCSLVSLYVNDEVDKLNFNETILTDNNSMIYTTVLEQSANGFSGSNLDFQLIVGENGDVTEATQYYFYIELS